MELVKGVRLRVIFAWNSPFITDAQCSFVQSLCEPIELLLSLGTLINDEIMKMCNIKKTKIGVSTEYTFYSN